VATYFGLVRPDLAMFGEKDYQQLVLVRQMADDLEQRVTVVGVPTVRDGDGLALSSRNAYLSPHQRASALVIPRSLFAARDAASAGHGARDVLATANDVLAAAGDVAVDYLELRSSDLARPATAGAARLLAAARVGTTRLIDNVPITL
jgi:pantoate--beta-alanine ligase